MDTFVRLLSGSLAARGDEGNIQWSSQLALDIEHPMGLEAEPLEVPVLSKAKSLGNSLLRLHLTLG